MYVFEWTNQKKTPPHNGDAFRNRDP